MTEKREELKPCPFCGSTHITTLVRRSLWRNSARHVHVATCYGCNAEGPQGEHLTAEAAIAAWNRRITREPSEDEMRRTLR